jgi:hypothetical protein
MLQRNVLLPSSGTKRESNSGKEAGNKKSSTSLLACLAYSLTLKIEAVIFSGTSDYRRSQSIRSYLRIHQNLKSKIFNFILEEMF